MPNQKNKIPSIAIVGGGYSGISMAANIHRFAQDPIQVYLIGSSMLFGKGLAYSTDNPLHLLNVRAKDMSALHHDNSHFVQWLELNNYYKKLGINSSEIPEEFISRSIYAKYLDAILNSLLKPSNSGCVVELIKSEALSVRENAEDISIGVLDGKELTVKKLILAYGHILPTTHFITDNSIDIIQNPWDFNLYKKIPEKSKVLIIGSGLTMIDAVIQLKSQNHSGKITALSRHGLMPHVNMLDSVKYYFNDNLFPMSLKKLISLVRSEIKLHPEQKGYHQALFKALRLRANDIWSSFTTHEKKQFIRHLAPYWEVVRHRIAPKVAEYVNVAIMDQTVEVISGRIVEVIKGSILIKIRHQQKPEKLDAEFIINCTGPEKYTHGHLNPIIDSLITQGLAQYNKFQLGLNVAESGAIINAAGVVSQNIFVLGPPRRGNVFETTAVREIRAQSEVLAKLCLSELFQ